MMLEVLSAGPMVSVQDQGRRGVRRHGVSPSGPMDPVALALANRLCGNGPDAAGLEFASIGGEFRADGPLCFAVTGGDCEVRIGGTPVPSHESHRLEAGDILSIGALNGAVWGYLAVFGGIDTPPVLGARATHLRFGLGGFEGRALKAGDRLPLGKRLGERLGERLGKRMGEQVGEQIGDIPLLRSVARAVPPTAGEAIRIVLGPQDDHFAPEVVARLTQASFRITRQRDRMASVLEGPDLPAKTGHDIISDATVPGVIQVPGSGKPMVLMAECQTTGGYPKIATVISADLPRLAQMPTGTAFRFCVVDRQTAETATRQQARATQHLLETVESKPDGRLTSEFLLSCELSGSVHDPEAVMSEGET